MVRCLTTLATEHRDFGGRDENVTMVQSPRSSGARSLWVRLQLPLGVGFMLAVSFASLAGLNVDALDTSNFRHTIIAATVAHILGYWSYRRFDVFPGLVSTGAVLPAFLLAYVSAFVVVLLLRLDYGRLQLTISFLASISWHVALDLVRARIQPYLLAIVPGGDTSRLHSIPDISWCSLDAPALPSQAVQGVVADLRSDHTEEWERFLATCALSGLPVYHVKQVTESLTGKVEIAHLSENTLGSLNPNQTFVILKQLLDWVGALICLIFLAPLLFVTAIIVRLDSPGPALFRQDRVGYRGRVFRVYKFRTMNTSGPADHADDKQRAMTKEGDVRVTRVGAVLRRSRIDELPQILNILRGDMSWIGPRPEAVPLSHWYESELPYYAYRHIVRPGITGWAQVNQGHVTSLDDVLEKLHFDFYYIKNLSPWLDFIIALRTVGTLVVGFGAK